MREPSTVATVSERSESVKKVTLRTIFASTSTQYACQTLSTPFRPMSVVLAQLDRLLNPTAGFAMPMGLTAVTLCYKLYLVCYKPRHQNIKITRTVDIPRYQVFYSTPNSYRIRGK